MPNSVRHSARPTGPILGALLLLLAAAALPATTRSAMAETTGAEATVAETYEALVQPFEIDPAAVQLSMQAVRGSTSTAQPRSSTTTSYNGTSHVAPNPNDYAPLALMLGLRLPMGLELWAQPDQLSRASFTFAFGGEIGLSIAPTRSFRITVQFLFIDFAQSWFGYDSPTSSGSTDAFGSRIGFGFEAEFQGWAFAIRFGQRSYWTNPEPDGFSVIGNDYARDIVHLGFAYQAPEGVRYGLTIEIPTNSTSSVVAILFDLSFRLFAPLAHRR